MDGLFACCPPKKDPLNTLPAAIPSILGLALVWSCSSARLNAQARGTNSDVSAIEKHAPKDTSLSTYFAVHVQSVRTRPEVDSLWTDSVWQWQGACTTPAALFHFQWFDPIDSSLTHSLIQEVECILEADENSNTEITFLGEMTTSLPDLHARAAASETHSSCFPPASDQQMLVIQKKMDEIIFESGKVQLAQHTIDTECLDKLQVKQLLQCIPSEDRRLDLLKTIPNTDHLWTPMDMEEIFQLQFMAQKALQLLDKP